MSKIPVFRLDLKSFWKNPFVCRFQYFEEKYGLWDHFGVFWHIIACFIDTSLSIFTRMGLFNSCDLAQRFEQNWPHLRTNIELFGTLESLEICSIVGVITEYNANGQHSDSIKLRTDSDSSCSNLKHFMKRENILWFLERI